ncbi:MAG TPA: shikimate kinase [Acidisarcina sp.]|nr:shikimate kinase [Acidisarcina sp.]
MQSSDPILNKPSRIVLLGFMGAGKSTVGSLLARHLGWAFHDADQVLETQSGLSIAELFSRYGEEGFRRMEAETVAGLMQLEEVVVALGGGAIENPATRALFQSSANTCTVFLSASLETMLGRCSSMPGVRPLLQDLDAIPARFERRLPHYQSANITVNTEGLTPNAVVQVLLERLPESSTGTPQEHSKGRSL